MPQKNIVITRIIDGNLPLQGTKEFVRIAISLSRFELIILQPVTPTALQPKPIQVVSACFPQEFEQAKHLSRLNAILGRYPKSSRRVNNGKNIAMGGSITAITHVVILYIPSRKLEGLYGKVKFIKKMFIKEKNGKTSSIQRLLFK